MTLFAKLTFLSWPKLYPTNLISNISIKLPQISNYCKNLVIDRKNGDILLKEIVKNPYFEQDSPHGARFAKAVRADRVLTKQIGDNAKQNLENFGIEVALIPLKKNFNDILEEIKNERKD